MNILLLYGNLPPHYDGGADYIFELARYLSREHKVVIPASEEVHEGFVSECDKLNISIEIISKHWRFGCLWKIYSKLLSLHSKHRINKIILVYPPARRGRAHRYLVPLILPFSKRLRNYDLVWFKPTPVWPSILEVFCSLIVPFFANVIVSHEQLYVDYGRKIPLLGKKVFWSPFGSTLQYPEIECGNTKSVSELGTFNIGFMGYWYKSKGVHVLLEAFEYIKKYNLIPNANLIFLGGRNKNEMKTKYEHDVMNLIENSDYNADIHFSGFLAEDQLARRLKSLNAYVLPFTFMFTSRSSLGPAVKLGLPAIVSSPNNLSSGFLRHGQHALLVKPKSCEELVAALVNLARDPALSMSLSSEITKLDPLYSWDSLLATFENKSNDFY